MRIGKHVQIEVGSHADKQLKMHKSTSLHVDILTGIKKDVYIYRDARVRKSVPKNMCMCLCADAPN